MFLMETSSIQISLPQCNFHSIIHFPFPNNHHYFLTGFKLLLCYIFVHIFIVHFQTFTRGSFNWRVIPNMEKWTKDMDDEVNYISLIWKLRCYYEEDWNERSQFLAYQQSWGCWTSETIQNGQIWFSNIKYVSCSYGFSNHLEHGFLHWWTCQGDLCGQLGPDACASFHLILYLSYEFPNNWGNDNKEG